MNIEIVRRVCLARYLYELGLASLKSSNELQLFAAANLLQDAVEAFLVGLAEHVGASIDQNTKFDKYFVAIEDRIQPVQLPFKAALNRLNRIRIDSKHYGIQPARNECDRLAVSVREFFEEVSSSILSASFSTISALDLLDEGEAKDCLMVAKQALDEGKHDECAIECRKALYVTIESSYDVSAHKEGKPVGMLDGYSLAPAYAQTKSYIDKNVRKPTDYIVFDHQRVEQELLKNRADPTDFWNVWRLTPQVYKSEQFGWVIEWEFDKLDEDVLADKSTYIYSTTVDLLLAIHTSRRRTRLTTRSMYVLALKRADVPVYSKADIGSDPAGITPPGLTEIWADHRVMGLKGDGPYWAVFHFEKGQFVAGYVHNDFVESLSKSK